MNKINSFISFLKRNNLLKNLLFHGLHYGFCPVCKRKTFFFQRGKSKRDLYFCIFCKSVPRHRAFMYVLDQSFPQWQNLNIYEPSPTDPISRALAQSCKTFSVSHFFPNISPGIMHDGYRCENLEQLTFGNEAFDIVITQDVFEHILDPLKAFKEIERVLKPGGAHIFTLPWFYWKKTFVRAYRNSEEKVEYTAPKEFHGNPIDCLGALVVTEWGKDMAEIIFAHSHMVTSVIRTKDKRIGTEDTFNDVFISTKQEKKTSVNLSTIHDNSGTK